MPRLNVVDPAQATGKVKEIFDGPLKGKHLNIFKGLANSPAALQAYLGIAGGLKAGELSAGEREIIALTIGQLNDCNYCLAAHTTLGKMAGLSEEQMIGSRRGRIEEPKLNALAVFARSLHERRGFVTDDELQAVRSGGYNDGQITEIVANYALNILTNYFNHVNDTEIDFPIAPTI